MLRAALALSFSPLPIQEQGNHTPPKFSFLQAQSIWTDFSVLK